MFFFKNNKVIDSPRHHSNYAYIKEAAQSKKKNLTVPSTEGWKLILVYADEIVFVCLITSELQIVYFSH